MGTVEKLSVSPDDTWRVSDTFPETPWFRQTRNSKSRVIRPRGRYVGEWYDANPEDGYENCKVPDFKEMVSLFRWWFGPRGVKVEKPKTQNRKGGA